MVKTEVVRERNNQPPQKSVLSHPDNLCPPRVFPVYQEDHL